ncbi:preprotein translocase subunit SecG [Microvirga tunisiensis]|uniref:Protein-export membrane protein SecG n=2 Tax=Pannonibacter tanglangensis TaxID=2750084 RepID=A0A7X5J8D0_9HYPH|nr:MULTISPECIES: preprotein translocase subunit SecG [unclassified Pannonibacter]NBN64115.1 preprotein translocase subunit SecG [Pannonibacter sp. XCT-34]NBN77757.1 preprotein translocase subunit SecG [Pannonibacter sp. XCT-53]
METVVIVIHLMVVLALVLVVLLQRSEGGALGMGGNSGFMTARGTANVLTRATALLAVAFFATSIGLSLIAEMDNSPASVLDTLPQTQTQGGEQGAPAPVTPGQGGGVLDALKQQSPQQPTGPQVPAAQ